MIKHTFACAASLAAGVLLLGTVAASAGDDHHHQCRMIHAHAHGHNLGNAQEQARTWLQGKADVYGVRHYSTVTFKITDMDCSRVGEEEFRCNAKAKACRTPHR